jgi:hypothetical protein
MIPPLFNLNMKTTKFLNDTFVVDDNLSLHIHADGKDTIKLTAGELNEICKNYQGTNRIHKPLALLFWIDVKNNNSKNWTLI